MPFCQNCAQEISEQAITCPRCGHPGPGAAAAQYAGAGAMPYATGPVYAGWWKRFLAAFIDGLVVAVPGFILGVILGLSAAEDVRVDPDAAPFSMSLSGNLAYILIAVLYKVLMEGSERGQTVGKMALGIRVRDADTGGPIGYGRAFVRWFVQTILWYLLVIPGLVDHLMPLWDKRKQSLHDKSASSVVVNA